MPPTTCNCDKCRGIKPQRSTPTHICNWDELAALLKTPELEAGFALMCDIDTGDPVLVVGVYDEETGVWTWNDPAGNPIDATKLTKCPDTTAIPTVFCDTDNPDQTWTRVMCKVGDNVDPSKTQWINNLDNTVSSTAPPTLTTCDDAQPQIIGKENMKDCTEGKEGFTCVDFIRVFSIDIDGIEVFEDFTVNEADKTLDTYEPTGKVSCGKCPTKTEEIGGEHCYKGEPTCDFKGAKVLAEINFEKETADNNGTVTEDGLAYAGWSSELGQSLNVSPTWGQLFGEGLYVTTNLPPSPAFHSNFIDFNPCGDGVGYFLANLQPGGSATDAKTLATKVDVEVDDCLQFTMQAGTVNIEGQMDAGLCPANTPGGNVAPGQFNVVIDDGTGPVIVGTTNYMCSNTPQTISADWISTVSGTVEVSIISTIAVTNGNDVFICSAKILKGEKVEPCLKGQYLYQLDCEGERVEDTKVKLDKSGKEFAEEPEECECDPEEEEEKEPYCGEATFKPTDLDGATNFSACGKTGATLDDLLAEFESDGCTVTQMPTISSGMSAIDLNTSGEFGGDASVGAQANEGILTPDLNNKKGSFGLVEKIDVTKDFCIDFQAYFGTTTGQAGADGIAFVIHNDPAGPSAFGIQGSGLGALSIQNGVAIEFDTYMNNNQGTTPPQQEGAGLGTPNGYQENHTAAWLTGGPSPFEPDNISGASTGLGEIADGQYHPIQVCYDAATNTLSWTFDGNAVGTATVDLAAVTGGQACFTYTASTGGAKNEHKIIVDSIEGELLDGGVEIRVECDSIDCDPLEITYDLNGTSTTKELTKCVECVSTTGKNDDRRDDLLQQLVDKESDNGSGSNFDDTNIIAAINNQKFCEDNDIELKGEGSNGIISAATTIPAGLKSLTVNNVTGTTTVSVAGGANSFDLGAGRRLVSHSWGTERGNCKNELLPEIKISGGTYQWTALR